MWINVSLFRSVGYRTISRYFRLSQPDWMHVFACGGSYHFPFLSSSLLPPPPSPLSLQYLCYPVIYLQSGGWHTLVLFCCTCWLFSTAAVCLSFALSSSLHPVPPCAAAAVSPGMVHFSEAALLHCYSSASVSLVAFPLLFSLITDEPESLFYERRQGGEGQRGDRDQGVLFPNCCIPQLVLHRLWFCARSERRTEQLVRGELSEGIHPHLSASILNSFVEHSAEDRRGRDWDQDFSFHLVLNKHSRFIDWTQVTELSWHQWTRVFLDGWDQEIYFILVW